MDKSADVNHGEKRKRDGKKQAEKEPSWVQSKCSEANLQDLVRKSILQPKEMIQWRKAEGEIFPSVGDSEIILFSSFVERGLALPTSDFLRGLLY